MPALDIHTAVQTALILAILVCVFSIWTGIRSILRANRLKFFRMRRDRMVRGWRLLFVGVGLILIILFLNGFAEPLIYRIYPPTATLTLTPTVTLTSTITLTPTISLTPSITPTPAVTDTPTITPTPHVPLAIEANFESVVTPNPDSVFSPLVFAQELDENYQPVNPSDVFQNPVGHLFAQFSYDKMDVGVQWTAIWYRGSEIVNFETKPWDGNVGGFGYTDWNPSPDQWLPGEYEVHLRRPGMDGFWALYRGRRAAHPTALTYSISNSHPNTDPASLGNSYPDTNRDTYTHPRTHAWTQPNPSRYRYTPAYAYCAHPRAHSHHPPHRNQNLN